MEPPGFFYRSRRVIGQQRRHFKRHKSIDTMRRIVNRTEQVGRLMQILESQFEKQILTGLALSGPLADGIVIRVAVSDREIEYCRIGCQSCDGKLVDITAERPSRQQFSGDVVQPKTLTKIMKLLCSFHRSSFWPIK